MGDRNKKHTLIFRIDDKENFLVNELSKPFKTKTNYIIQLIMKDAEKRLNGLKLKNRKEKRLYKKLIKQKTYKNSIDKEIAKFKFKDIKAFKRLLNHSKEIIEVHQNDSKVMKKELINNINNIIDSFTTQSIIKRIKQLKKFIKNNFENFIDFYCGYKQLNEMLTKSTGKSFSFAKFYLDNQIENPHQLTIKKLKK